jgi:hypothetical protein
MLYGIKRYDGNDIYLNKPEEQEPKLNVPLLCFCNRYELCFKKDRKFVEYHIPMIGYYKDDYGRKYFSCEGDYYKVVEWCYLPYYTYDGLE